MHEIETALANIRAAWLAGRSALEGAPQNWRDAVGNDELALLALAGHATDVLTHRTSTALVERPLLPVLSISLVPEPLRPRFRRLLATPKNTMSIERSLIAFVAARGYAAHPADWMPGANDDWAPDIYSPWLDWVRTEARTVPSDSEITADTYDQWSWSERRKALEKMRARDPAKALAIISAKAGGEPAERRLRLVELLHTNLSGADAEYLEVLAKDRSDRVQALVRAFLARLGRGGDVSALARELAEMVELTKVGLVKRRAQLVFKPLKTAAQSQRRRELFTLVNLSALAQALSATELQLVESAPNGSFAEAAAFAACVAETGADDTARALAETYLSNSESPPSLLLPLAPRLAPEERASLLQRVIKRDADLFETALAFAGSSLGAAPLSAVTSAQSYGALRNNLEIFARGEDSGRAGAARILEAVLPRVGLLIDAAGSRELLTQITAWGLSPADPKLDMLHFNAALTETAT